MKLKEDFLITEIGTEYVAVPVGAMATEFKGVVQLNETAAAVWRGISDGLDEKQIAEQITAEYDVDMDKAMVSVTKVVDQIRKAGFLVE